MSGEVETSLTLKKPVARGALIEKFSWIQNIIWIESPLERPMKVARNGTAGFRPPAFLSQPDSMFAGNDSAPLQYLRE